MFNVFTNCIVFELCLVEKKKKKKKKKEDERIEIFMFGFLDFAKG